MRIAIIHYHLLPGGVTSVILTTSDALTATGVRHVILTGGDASLGENHRIIPALGYMAEPGNENAATLLEALRRTATDALGGPPDVWHFHNHSLGKNILIPHVVSQLATAGEAILLHLHDLAEDGRPENHPLIAGIEDLYPFSPRVHLAFLNPRDLETFTAAGLPPENGSVLANPIPTFETSPPPSASAPLLFAPARGIRRKNLGELALLAALAPAGVRVAISRAPENPAAQPVYDTWRGFATRHRLPIGFGVVDRYSPVPGAATGFDSWLAHASHFITTSVAEGFGLTFLEAVAHGRPLLGRNIPHLTSSLGLNPGRLYDAIRVPLDWVDFPVLREQLILAMQRDARLLHQPLSPSSVNAAMDALICDGQVDFGNLPEPLQQGVIERTADASQRATPLVRLGDATRPLVDWLEETLQERKPSATPDQLAPWSPQIYQTKLTDLYRQLAAAPKTPLSHVSPEAILARHQRPENFHFLLSSNRPESPPAKRFRAVVFDIYGTLLIAPSGGVKPDPFIDPVLREIIRQAGNTPPASPSSDLHAAVLRHHAAAESPFPEVDLRVLWREILHLDDDHDVSQLVLETEQAWHPARPMPGAISFIQRLSRGGISLGLLSNAQCNTLPTLGPVADFFAPELTLLSYQLGIAKPSPEIYQTMVDRLSGRGIAPDETLFVGNDPLHDIIPAAAVGFRTALYIGHPDSIRPGNCLADITFKSWTELAESAC